MTRSAPRTNRTAPAWRTPAIIGAVLLLAAVAGIVFALVLNRDPEATGGEPSPSPSPTPAAPTEPSAAPSASEDPEPTETPEPSPVAAPDEWTTVHEFGDGTAHWVGGEIAWGDAGFVAVGRQFGGSEGGTHLLGYSMWRSPDGQTWSEVAYPNPQDSSEYAVTALTGAADGSYVLHAQRFFPGSPGNELVSLRSTDGETWERLETGLAFDIAILAIEEGPSGYLLVAGAGGDPITSSLWLSDDALTWELVHEFDEDEQQYVQIHDADGGAEGYVVTGRRGQRDGSGYERFVLASANGREWVERTAPFGPDDQEYVWDVAVTSHGGNWFATLGDRNERITLWSSADGLEWAEGATLQGPERSLASPGLFEEVGGELILSPGATVIDAGAAGTWSSADGTTWSPVDLGTDAYLGELAIGDGVVAITGTIRGTGEGAGSTGAIFIRATD